LSPWQKVAQSDLPFGAEPSGARTVAAMHARPIRSAKIDANREHGLVHLRGDAIAHPVRTAYVRGNDNATRGRRVVTLRYLGEDVRYREHPGAAPDSAHAAERSRRSSGLGARRRTE
jgi:hypothetical protein